MIFALRFPFRLISYWMLFFFLFRSMLLISQFLYSPGENYSGWFLTYFHGLRLDFAATAYICAIPVLLWLIYLIVPNRKIEQIIKFYLVFVTGLITLTCLSNIIVYRAWGTLLNVRALSFAAQPKEMFASLSNLQLFLLVISICILFYVFISLLRKIVFPVIIPADRKKYWFDFIIRICFIALIPIGMRGGIQLIPVNESAAYFSPVPMMNHIATNPVWYLLNNIWKTDINSENPCQFMSDEKAVATTKALFNPHPTVLEVLKNKKPNIILIVLESWTADIIEPLNGDKGVTPFFTSLCDSGLLFNSIYAAGRRTDQMFPSVLSGFPAQPNHSIVRYAGKIEKLPVWSAVLENQGYHTSFYYGGELGFANMNTFLLHGKFHKITGEEAFPKNEMNSKWGAHDEYVLQKQLDDLQNEKQPFLSMLLTLSSHEPFEVPMKHKFKGSDDPSLFRNAAYYTDLCLKNYFEKAKKQSWYNNTLFILVADHGHVLPRKRDYFDPAVNHIPLLFFGENLKQEWKGKKYPALGSQHDIPATILHQLDLPSTDFNFSNDLLDTGRTAFAYFNLDEAFGWLRPNQQLVYFPARRQEHDKFTIPLNPSDSIEIQNGLSYLQLLYKKFLDY